MDFHLEHGLRLHTEPEYKNLYDWAINEIDAQGRKIGVDQIPWPWSFRFSATACGIYDSIDINSRSPAPPEIEQRQIIRVSLRPGSSWDDGDSLGETTFSMFGTDRAIKSFQLHIHPIADPAEQESCTAWGSASYTTEIDFRDETVDDTIVFYLFVTPEAFSRYATKIAHGLVDEVILRVGSVAGFYSEWSPSISTSNVKVLTAGAEQQITLPSGYQIEPPRLGYVGNAELHINRRLKFR